MVDNIKSNNNRGEVFSAAIVDRMYQAQQEIARIEARIAEFQQRVNLLQPGLALIKQLGAAAMKASEYRLPTHTVVHLKKELGLVLGQMNDPKLRMPDDQMKVLLDMSAREYESAEKLKSGIVQFMMAQMETVASSEMAIDKLESRIEELRRDQRYHANRLAETNCDHSADPDVSRPGLTF